MSQSYYTTIITLDDYTCNTHLGLYFPLRRSTNTMMSKATINTTAMTQMTATVRDAVETRLNCSLSLELELVLCCSDD